ncbi:MAG: hypothetical protein OXT09_10800 [Myxococcales bacterium]|nr:hypothetical protein [Myxococcales bacterium]
MRTVSILLLALGACSEPPPPPSSSVTVETRTPDGSAVEGVRLWASGQPLGATDARGRLSTELARSTTLTALCPPTHEAVTPERRVQITGDGGELAVRFECAPLRQLGALVVRTSGAPAGLPVRAHGEVVGHTDEHGLAHVLLETRPGTPLRVSLDTGSEGALRPQDPVQTFRLGEGDQVLLFEQAFERKRKQRARRRPRQPATTGSVPYRIR